VDSNAHDESGPAIAPQTIDVSLSPERRLNLIADIVIRGIARLLIAEDNAARGDDARITQAPGITAEVALLNGGGDALMVTRGEERPAQGGRTR
jgi:hypothetical protein